MSSLLKAVYDTNAFVPHAALLRQGCPHCAIFPTAASRRSLGRISVPMWPVGLSTRLPVVGWAGRCPAHYLMGRDPIHRRRSFPPPRMRGEGDIGYQSAFRRAVPVRWAGWSRVTHPFATLYAPEGALTVRLACVRHAASVHPEPGSNSPFEKALQVKSINVVRPHLMTRAQLIRSIGIVGTRFQFDFPFAVSGSQGAGSGPFGPRPPASLALGGKEIHYPPRGAESRASSRSTGPPQPGGGTRRGGCAGMGRERKGLPP